MLDTLLDRLDPIIAEAIFGLVMLYAGNVVRLFFRNKESQDNLHKALETGVDYVTDELADFVQRRIAGGLGGAPLSVPNDLVQRISEYAETSVPGAIKTIKQATPEKLMEMARAKANVRVTQLRDMLAFQN